MDDDWILVDQTKRVRVKTAASSITGYYISELEECWFAAFNRFSAPGGGAEQKLGPIAVVDLRFFRKDGPVHRSRFNPEDKRLVLTCTVTAVSGEERKCHIFETGKGTKWVGDREQ